MATTRYPVDDPARLPGFVTHNGIDIVSLGDDDETLIALGHQQPARAAAAFETYVVVDLLWSRLSAESAAFDNAQEAAGAVAHQWAVFYRHPIVDGGFAPAGWGVDLYDTEQPGSVPVTTLDCG